MLHSELRVDSLRLPVFLGMEKLERSEKQEVLISFSLNFQDCPKLCLDDQAQDFLCYDECCQLLRRVATRTPYRSIEHLSFQCFAALKERIPPEISLSLELKKLKTPVAGLEGGAVFRLRDPLNRTVST